MSTQTPLRSRIYVTSGVAISAAILLSLLLRMLAVADDTAAGWTPIIAMQTGTASVRAAIHDNKLYLIGGETKGGATNQVLSGDINADGSINVVETERFSLPVSVYLHTVVNYGQYLYVIGGWDGNRRYSNVWWNTVAFTADWNKTTFYPRKIVLHEAVVAGDALYVIGGVDENNVPLSEVQSTKINSNTGELLGWHLTMPITRALFRHSVAVDGNYIYVSGGYDGKQASDQIYYGLADGQGNIQNWNLATLRLPQPLYYHQSFVRAGKLWILGGKNDNTQFDTVISTPVDFDHNLRGKWWPEAKLPFAVNRFSAVALENCLDHFVFSIGGLHENIHQTQIYRTGTRSEVCSYLPWVPVNSE